MCLEKSSVLVFSRIIQYALQKLCVAFLCMKSTTVLCVDGKSCMRSFAKALGMLVSSCKTVFPFSFYFLIVCSLDVLWKIGVLIYI